MTDQKHTPADVLNKIDDPDIEGDESRIKCSELIEAFIASVPHICTLTVKKIEGGSIGLAFGNCEEDEPRVKLAFVPDMQTMVGKTNPAAAAQNDMATYFAAGVLFGKFLDDNDISPMETAAERARAGASSLAELMSQITGSSAKTKINIIDIDELLRKDGTRPN